RLYFGDVNTSPYGGVGPDPPSLQFDSMNDVLLFPAGEADRRYVCKRDLLVGESIQRGKVVVQWVVPLEQIPQGKPTRPVPRSWSGTLRGWLMSRGSQPSKPLTRRAEAGLRVRQFLAEYQYDTMGFVRATWTTNTGVTPGRLRDGDQRLGLAFPDDHF